MKLFSIFKRIAELEERIRTLANDTSLQLNSQSHRIFNANKEAQSAMDAARIAHKAAIGCEAANLKAADAIKSALDLAEHAAKGAEKAMRMALAARTWKQRHYSWQCSTCGYAAEVSVVTFGDDEADMEQARLSAISQHSRRGGYCNNCHAVKVIREVKL